MANKAEEDSKAGDASVVGNKGLPLLGLAFVGSFALAFASGFDWKRSCCKLGYSLCRFLCYY